MIGRGTLLPCRSTRELRPSPPWPWGTKIQPGQMRMAGSNRDSPAPAGFVISGVLSKSARHATRAGLNSLLSARLFAGGLLRKSRNTMKTMESGVWLGANRSNSRSYCEDEQRRHGTQGAFSCFGTCEADHQAPPIHRQRQNPTSVRRKVQCSAEWSVCAEWKMILGLAPNDFPTARDARTPVAFKCIQVAKTHEPRYARSLPHPG